MLLAAAPDGTLGWLDSLQWVVTLVLGVALLWNKMFPGTQKREVSFTGIPVDRKDFDQHVDRNGKEHDGIHSKIGGTERGLRTEIQHLRDKVDKVDKDVGRLETSTNLQNQQLAAIDAKVTKLLECGHHQHSND